MYLNPNKFLLTYHKHGQISCRKGHTVKKLTTPSLSYLSFSNPQNAANKVSQGATNMSSLWNERLALVSSHRALLCHFIQGSFRQLLQQMQLLSACPAKTPHIPDKQQQHQQHASGQALQHPGLAVHAFC
jgi:hypothetical protein